ncbi:MAG: sensor histidine kinase [Gemmatimonadaceae bacterium]
MSPGARPPRRGSAKGTGREGKRSAAAAVPPAAVPPEPLPNGEVERQALAALGARQATVSEALDAAVAEVTEIWAYGEHSRITPGDVHATAAALAAGLRDVMSGGSPAVDALLPFVPARHVLERMRRAVLESADQSPDARGMLALAAAFEKVQSALDAHAAQRFAGRLSAADAQQLIVEMAHDMRSPLGSILILAERLRAGAGGELTAVQQRQLGLVYSAAFGLSAIASDVIELARGGTTLVDVQTLPFSVADVLQSMLDILRPMAEEKRLTMTASGPRADIRMGHASALNRVLLNLATNAIKFTNTGSVAVTCRELDKTRVELSVQDTGRGIPKHVLDNLFEAFRQRHSPGDYAFSSAGLGLSICQLLVRAMGGELQVETELERGTRFYFTLDLPQAGRM